MIERMQHAAGFTVVDRRNEHKTLSTGWRGETVAAEEVAPTVVGFVSEEVGPDSPQVAPEEFARGVTVDRPGWYQISGGFPAGRKRQARRSGSDAPPPDKAAPTLADLRHARSVVAGSVGAYAAPLNDEQRYSRYMLQERCRRDGVGRGDRVPTSKQRRRIDHKRNRARARLTSAAVVK